MEDEMDLKKQDRVHRVNCLSNDLDALYHRVARSFGLADSILIVAYMIHEKGDGCLLYDICSTSGLSKQTVNSAIRSLENDGVLFLEQDRGKTKRVRLTKAGRDFIERTAGRLFEAECDAFKNWSNEEFETYLRLMAKYNDTFKTEVEKIDGLGG